MYSGKNVLILGLMRSGIAAAELLCQHGAKVVLCDANDNEKIRTNIASLAKYNLETHLSTDPISLLPQADILLISPGVPIDAPVVLAAKAMGKEVIGELEHAYTLSQNPVLAITGTNGKTTSVTLLGEIMKNTGKVSHVVGNVGYPYSSAVLNAGAEDVMVCEVSSFQLETTKEFHPAVAALLNITEDHLNRHKTMEEYMRLKLRIFEKQSKFDIAVLNYDDAFIQEHKAHILSKIPSQVLWFSRKAEVKEGAYVKGDGLYVRFAGQENYICNINKIKIPGPHNLENAMAVACMAIAMRVKPQIIGHTLHRFSGVEHRIETIAIKEGITYINDSKGTNPDSTEKAVASMAAPTNIILGGYDKNADFHALCKAIVENEYIQNAILIGQTAKQIAECLENVGFTNFTFAGNMVDAVVTAKALAKQNYNVLLSPACASFDMYTDYEARGEHFRSIVETM